MLIEMRTYQLRPATLAEAEKRFAAALPARERHSPLSAFWHSEIGPLNQIIHIWTYDTFEHRARVRAAAAREPGWPPAIQEFTVSQQSEIFVPAPFSLPLTPRDVGPIFEIRQYTLVPGALPEMIERWSRKIDERVKLSPLVGAWYSEFGALNKWVHIWAYRDAAERQRIRAEAVGKGLWPPGGAASGIVIRQENTIVMPSSFSPIR